MQTAGGASALMYACQQCRETEVEEIIRKQPHSVRERDRTSKTPLHYCAENGDTSCAEVILRAAPELVDAQDDNGYCPLHLAVIAGNRALMKLLIARGANVNVCDNERHSAVHWAIVSSEKEALEMIIRAGANPSTPDVRGGYPLHYAVQMCGSICGCDYSRTFEDAVRVVETLLNFGVDVNVTDKDSRQPILWAASAGSADAIIHLVSAGACVEAADKDGLTALHCAASRGHTATLETLISLCGAHVDVIDGNGCSALFYSVTLGHADATELLLRLGAEPNRQDRKGRTPAHCGAAKGQLETLRILQKHGGNLWLRNVKGDVPLHEAVASGRKDLVLWLLSQSPDAINLANNDGRCPLHIASMYNNTEMVKVLLDAKSLVNPVMRTSKGVLMTPLNVALSRGHRTCGKYLQLHGGVPFSKVARLEPASVFAVRVSPSDEMIKSVDVQKENSSPRNIPRSRSSVENLASPQLKKEEEREEKKKVYRRRKKKKSGSKVMTQESESDESVEDLTMKTSTNRRVKRSDVKGEQSEKTRVKRVQLETKSLKTETMSSKSVSGANSNREEEEGKREEEEEEEGEKEKRKNTKALLSNKSLNETKNVSNLSPEDFPPQMETIDRLDAVTMEPEIEVQREELQDGMSETILVGNTVESVRVEKDYKTEMKNDESKKVESFKEKNESEEVSKAEKTEKNEKNELKKSKDDISNRKSVKSPKISNLGKKDEKISKGSEVSKQMKKAMSHKSDKVGGEDLSKKSFKEEEREDTMNVDKETVEGLKGSETRNVKNLEDVENKKYNVDNDRGEIDESETYEVLRIEKVFVEEGKIGRKDDFNTEEKMCTSSCTQLLSEDKEKNEIKEDKDKNENKEEKKEEKKNEEEKGKKNEEKEEELKEEKEINIKKESKKEKKEEEEEKEKSQGTKIEEEIEESKKEKEEKEKGEEIENKGEEEGKETEGKLEKKEEENSFLVLIGETFVNELEREEKGGEKEEERGEEKEIEKKVSLSVESSGEQLQNDGEIGRNDAQVSMTFPHSNLSSATLSTGGSHNDTKVVKNKVVEKVNTENINYTQEIVNAKEAEEEIIKEQKAKEEKLEKNENNETEDKNIIFPVKKNKKVEEEMREKNMIFRAEKGGKEEGKEYEKEEKEDERKSQKKTNESEGGEAKGPRVVRLCRRQKDLKGDVSDVSVTQLVQNTLRKYHMERGIFYQLLELKRYQIRSGKAKEQVLVKRLADEYDRERVFLGMKPYTGFYRFREFEKFLYDQLKALNARRSFLVPEATPRDDIDALSALLNRTRHGILHDASRDPQTGACTCITQRCHHSACAYTSVPCAAYITDLRRHKRYKPKREGFFPRIEHPPSFNSQEQEINPRPATLELVQGSEKHVITLPQNSPATAKRYYVTFTIKGAPASEDERFRQDTNNSFKHRHAKTV